MNNVYELAHARLLAPAGLDDAALDQAFTRLLTPGIDFADLYFQHSRHESWALDDGIVKEGSHSIEQGVGVRAVSGEKTGFAYSDDIRLESLLDAASAARAIARAGQQASAAVRGVRDGRALYAPLDPMDSLDNDAKVRLLREVDAFVRSADARVIQVSVSLAGVLDTVLVARSDGVLAGDVRPLVRCNVQVIVEHQGRREQGYAGGGGRYGYPELLQSGRALDFAREALCQAVVNCRQSGRGGCARGADAGRSRSGLARRPVARGSRIGHGLEGDFNRKGTSTYSGRMGEQVASTLCTIVDDGTLTGRRGSLNLDDEGCPTQCTTLIEQGRLVGYMQDSLNARLMGVAPTGNGRRESFAALPMPRMTNTYMLAGPHDPEEIIRSVSRHSLGITWLVRTELWWRAGRHHLGQVRVFGQ